MNLTAELFTIDNRYNVTFQGELVVEGSRDPECDLARVLDSRGYTGKVTMLDGRSGKPRTIIIIQKAAKVTAVEGPNGPKFVKYCPQTVLERPYSPETVGVA